MRNEEKWLVKYRQQIIEEDFTPRIQQDLNRIDPPEDLPELESLYIQGPVGSGKTILAAFLYLEAWKQKYLKAIPGEYLFISTSDLFEEIKQSYNNPTETEQGILDKCSYAQFLVIDDFGAERSTDWVMSLLYVLINRRYEQLLPTIFTSNLTLGEISKKFSDERIPARIERMCKIIEKTEF